MNQLQGTLGEPSTSQLEKGCPKIINIVPFNSPLVESHITAPKRFSQLFCSTQIYLTLCLPQLLKNSHINFTAISVNFTFTVANTKSDNLQPGVSCITLEKCFPWIFSTAPQQKVLVLASAQLASSLAQVMGYSTLLITVSPYSSVAVGTHSQKRKQTLLPIILSSALPRSRW